MLQTKDLVSMRDINAEDINEILKNAELLKQILLSGNKKAPHLQGKSIVTLFYENSTRTRMSFDLQANIFRLQAQIFRLLPQALQKEKRFMIPAGHWI